ncbi:MAG: RNA methyltransferase [Prevotella sp.]|nr:RNA methyltransferase [Prevotella sp.]
MISKNQFKFIRQLEQKKFRRREGLFVAEGTKVVGDLLQRYQPHSVYATAEWIKNNPTTEATEVCDDELRRLSFQQHPQQVLALFPLPQGPKEAIPETVANLRSFTTKGMQEGLSLALDGIQDPGNLGTIIRIADWFGISTIYCSDDTVDAYNPKVVQATMGSIARVNIIYIDLTALLKSLPQDFPVYGTFLDGENIYTQELSNHGLIIMGNEGNGISGEVRALVNRRLLIPNFHNGDTVDSLNVAIATAITCSEFRRRQ